MNNTHSKVSFTSEGASNLFSKYNELSATYIALTLESLGSKAFAESQKAFEISIESIKNLASTPTILSEMQTSLESVISANKSIINELATSSPASIEDYVTLNKPETGELTIPETIALPIGNKRIRMSTNVFIAIIGSILLPLLFHISDTIVNLYQSAAEAKTEQQRLDIQQERNDLIREGNLFYKQCYDALQSLDSSHSSHSETIESWKESLPAIDLSPGESDSNPYSNQ